MTDNLREGINALYLVCDLMETMKFNARVGIYESPRKILTVDLVRFLCTLSVSDGTVTWEETNIINEIFEKNKIQQITPQEVFEIVKSIAFDDYSKEMPTSLKLFISFDLNAQAEKELMRFKYQVSDILINVFLLLGNELIACDGNVDTAEKFVLNTYISQLKSYANNEMNKGQNNQSDSTSFIGGKR